MEASSFALAVKLQAVCSAVAQHISPTSLSAVQAWLPAAPTSEGEWSLYASPLCCVLNDTGLQQFRLKSCHYPVAFRQSMTGRVWKTGAVQVVQNLRLVPPTMHPRVYLTDADLDRLGEALYIPVYDPTRPGLGPITVLEALLPAHCAVLPADLLSFLCDSLTALKLSVSSPQPQPIKRSALTGRRARPPADSAPDLKDKHGQEHANEVAGSGGCKGNAAPAVKGVTGKGQQLQPACPTKRVAVAITNGVGSSSNPAAINTQSISTHNVHVPCHGQPMPGSAGPVCLGSAPVQNTPAAMYSPMLACWGMQQQQQWAQGFAGFGGILSASIPQQPRPPQVPASSTATASAPNSGCTHSCSTVAAGSALLQPSASQRCEAHSMLRTGSDSGPTSLPGRYDHVSMQPATDNHIPAGDEGAEQLPRKIRKLSSSGLVRSKSMYRVDQAHTAGDVMGTEPLPRLATPQPAVATVPGLATQLV